MLYCDLAIDSTPIWYGVPCLNRVLLKSRVYLSFKGELFFQDDQGKLDPDWTGLGQRYHLLYAPSDGSSVVEIPLQAEPAQNVNVILSNQTCTLSFYTRVKL